MARRTGDTIGRGVLWLLLAVAGCGDARTAPVPTAVDPGAAVAAAFDPAAAGTISGRVTWVGAIPTVAPFSVSANPPAGPPWLERQVRPNPNAPVVDPGTGGVGNAVVFLRGVDPHRGKPWDQSPVRVEQRHTGFQVRQGEATSPFGFVRRGDAVTLVSAEPVFHALHADGAAFFSLAFPDPDRPLSRRLPERGLVELTSAAGYYWVRAYLFVDDHPYYTRTDAAGRFVLRAVPAGRYEVVAWMPSWYKARHEREPETGALSRVAFGPPAEVVQPLTLRPGETGAVQLTFTPEDFSRAAGP